eukprot:gene11425-23897_t
MILENLRLATTADSLEKIVSTISDISRTSHDDITDPEKRLALRNELDSISANAALVNNAKLRRRIKRLVQFFDEYVEGQVTSYNNDIAPTTTTPTTTNNFISNTSIQKILHFNTVDELINALEHSMNNSDMESILNGVQIPSTDDFKKLLLTQLNDTLIKKIFLNKLLRRRINRLIFSLSSESERKILQKKSIKPPTTASSKNASTASNKSFLPHPLAINASAITSSVSAPVPVPFLEDISKPLQQAYDELSKATTPAEVEVAISSVSVASLGAAKLRSDFVSLLTSIQSNESLVNNAKLRRKTKRLLESLCSQSTENTSSVATTTGSTTKTNPTISTSTGVVVEDMPPPPTPVIVSLEPIIIAFNGILSQDTNNITSNITNMITTISAVRDMLHTIITTQRPSFKQPLSSLSSNVIVGTCTSRRTLKRLLDRVIALITKTETVTETCTETSIETMLPLDVLKIASKALDPLNVNRNKTSTTTTMTTKTKSQKRSLKKDENDNTIDNNNNKKVKTTATAIKRVPYVLFVGQLSYDTTEESLRNHFVAHGIEGPVTIRMRRDAITGLSKGTSFVEVCSPKELYKALSLQGSVLDGRTINVEKSCGGRNRDNRLAKLEQMRSGADGGADGDVEPILGDRDEVVKMEAVEE